MKSIESLQYPIGRFEKPEIISAEQVQQWIGEIESFPQRLKDLVLNLSEDVLDTPYRPGGWTIRQVVHHCADSHMHSLIRFKWALTEDQPTIKPYFEERWAELADSKTMDIYPALLMLEGIHARWTVLLKSLSKEDLQRSFIHPESGRTIPLNECIGIYAWHGNHHLAHIAHGALNKA